MNANGPPERAAHRHLTATAPATGQVADVSVTDLLELSRERDIYEARIISAWKQGFACGRDAGWQEGYDACTADQAAEWDETRRILKAAVHASLDPEGDIRQRLRAAEAAERRDAAVRERAFVARAYATPPHLRSDAQKATVQSYAPARKDGAA